MRAGPAYRERHSPPASCNILKLGSHLDQNGAAGRIRTDDLLITNELLYP
jgi:hypothetical protein